MVALVSQQYDAARLICLGMRPTSIDTVKVAGVIFISGEMQGKWLKYIWTTSLALGLVGGNRKLIRLNGRTCSTKPAPGFDKAQPIEPTR